MRTITIKLKRTIISEFEIEIDGPISVARANILNYGVDEWWADSISNLKGETSETAIISIKGKNRDQ